MNTLNAPQVKACSKCSALFTPTAHQIKKHSWLCIECTRKYQKQWRYKRTQQGLKCRGTASHEWFKAYFKRYYARPEIKAHRAELMRGYAKNPKLRHKHVARWIAHRALNANKITRKPCRICGSIKSQMHHPDYSKPLEIEWLCLSCHRQEHAKAEGKL